MRDVRLGAVAYLNARPLVFGLDRTPGFSLRFDLPSRCADLLHGGAIDIGLIPSIEYLQAPGAPYAIVPDLAIASCGPVASVALYTKRPMHEVRSIALDTSSRTSVALVRVLCARVFNIQPSWHGQGPDLPAMLARADAALVIGDNALVLGPGEIVLRQSDGEHSVLVEKIDLGQVWTEATGLPFVYAMWAGREGCLTGDDVAMLQRARNEGVRRPQELSAEYFREEPQWRELGARYLRDNIKYTLGPDERAGLDLFYRYAVEVGAAASWQPPRFF
jgi:chorismate dehydratase